MSLLDDPKRLGEHVADFRARHPKKPMRQEFGAIMLALAERRPDVFAVTADLMYATGLVEFGARFPDRLVNVGIAEQNMIGVAAGLGGAGKLPVVCGYAAFIALRAVEQVKVDCAYNETKVILAGLSSGLTYGVGGPTHQTYEDLATLRAMPNTIVIVPNDTVQAALAMDAAVEHPGNTPIYLRLGRGPEHVLTKPGDPFRIGRANRLCDGDDVCLVANGALTFEAYLAADILRGEGIAAEVLDMHTVKPIDREAILDAAGRVDAMVVAEEHSRSGGLGAAVLEVLEDGHDFPVARIGLEDEYPPIGPMPDLRHALGLSGEAIARRARLLLDRKRSRRGR